MIRRLMSGTVLLLFLLSVMGSHGHALLFHHDHDQLECLATGNDVHLHGEDYLPTDCSFCDWTLPPYLESPALPKLSPVVAPLCHTDISSEDLACKSVVRNMMLRGPPCPC